jgi:excisionase family DNA binding protein
VTLLCSRVHAVAFTRNGSGTITTQVAVRENDRRSATKPARARGLPLLLRISEAAYELRVSRRTIYNLIAAGLLEHVAVNERNSRVTSRSVRRAAARRSKPAPIANLKDSGAAK